MKNSLSHEQGSEVSERASEQTCERYEPMNERMAQCLRLDSCWFQTTVGRAPVRIHSPEFSLLLLFLFFLQFCLADETGGRIRRIVHAANPAFSSFSSIHSQRRPVGSLQRRPIGSLLARARNLGGGGRSWMMMMRMMVRKDEINPFVSWKKLWKVLGSATEWVGRGSNGGQGKVVVSRGSN